MASQAQLDEARAALHKLHTGKSAASIRKGDRLVEFTPVNMSELKQYVDELEAQLGGTQRRRGPARLC